MTPATLPLVLFGVTYLLLAIGRIPGLALDWTGFAVLGALAFLATGGISLEEAKAAIDAPTLTLLFSMMLLSAQYQMSGLYGDIGRRLTRVENPRRAGRASRPRRGPRDRLVESAGRADLRPG